MTRAELSEMAESFHALAAQAEAIERQGVDAATYSKAALAWQQVFERLCMCMIDHALSVSFPMMVWSNPKTVH